MPEEIWEAFTHVHGQVMLWLSYLDSSPPSLPPEHQWVSSALHPCLRKCRARKTSVGLSSFQGELRFGGRSCHRPHPCWAWSSPRPSQFCPPIAPKTPHCHLVALPGLGGCLCSGWCKHAMKHVCIISYAQSPSDWVLSLLNEMDIFMEKTHCAHLFPEPIWLPLATAAWVSFILWLLLLPPFWNCSLSVFTLPGITQWDGWFHQYYVAHQFWLRTSLSK